MDQRSEGTIIKMKVTDAYKGFNYKHLCNERTFRDWYPFFIPSNARIARIESDLIFLNKLAGKFKIRRLETITYMNIFDLYKQTYLN